VAGIGIEQGFGRLLDTSRYELTWNDRLEMNRATLVLWQRFPVFGTGLGTYREAFPLAQVAPRETVPFHAHNDWLEVLATTGIAGLAVVLFGLGVVVRALLRRLDAGLRSEDRAAALAALGALAAVSLHSLFDFGLTIPANAVTLAVLTGAALGVRRGDRPESTAKPAPG
jgi:O-antigen ligase